MIAEIRMTVPVARVLAALVADPTGDHYGMELMQSSELPSGTLYPILARLTEADWLEKRWEQVDPSAAGRPARAYYRLTSAFGDSSAWRSSFTAAERSPKNILILIDHLR
jgi:PadR family transcriptional regulator PadR